MSNTFFNNDDCMNFNNRQSISDFSIIFNEEKDNIVN